MKKKQNSLRLPRQHHGWPLDYDVLCWIGAIALILLFFGVDQFFVSKLPGTGAIEHPHSIPQRIDLPAAHALALLDRDRQ
ncbi:hypothetical protein [Pseudomonas nitroreducens]|uniref:hypothetical protein n=1 Tax=Pseudomonas nitroreducens TaxID=46680 RepID=UPI002D7E55F6|nr:hypothetical protein [Pseudomonas nitroreducens]